MCESRLSPVAFGYDVPAKEGYIRVPIGVGLQRTHQGQVLHRYYYKVWNFEIGAVGPGGDRQGLRSGIGTLGRMHT